MPLVGMLVLVALAGTGCVSTHMKKFVGKDVRYIEIEDGAPVKVLDLPDGRRAFQYLWGGGRYVVPQTITTQGQVELVGDKAYYTERKLQSGGYVVDNPGCVITYIAEWNAAKTGWIVADISFPRRAVC
jgi:hypothetical protein